MMKKIFTAILLVFTLLLYSCREEIGVIQPEKEKIEDDKRKENSKIKGFFLLNEGNMGSNKASLDFYDYIGKVYFRNIFAERNPDVVKELGDVGNDLKIYDNKLFAIINASNIVVVMDVNTAKQIAVIDIPNARYVDFKDGYAYISSYAGPIKLNDPNSREGYIAKVDCKTFEIVDRCNVGYQPDGVVVVGDKLYVANSGGYRAPNYDNRVSVIDLKTFKLIKHIEVAINLGAIVKDSNGLLYVTSRGDYNSIKANTYMIDSKSDRLIGSIGMPAHKITIHNDKLYGYYTDVSKPSLGVKVADYFVYDTKTQNFITKRLLSEKNASSIKVPYLIAVDPETEDIFIGDAGNYVSPGTLICFDKNGNKKWSVRTGDIPSSIAFTEKTLIKVEENEKPEEKKYSPYIYKVLEYRPAIGQFVNTMPEYVDGDTEETMRIKAENLLANNQQGMVNLGAYGGYIVFSFDHTVENKDGRDINILGNAFNNKDNINGIEVFAGSSEAGIVMVAQDKNKNGKPDDNEWFEIAGSAHGGKKEAFFDIMKLVSADINFYNDYQITYYKPEKEINGKSDKYIRWEDNKGNSGYKSKNEFHSQPYFPQWINDNKLVFKGSRLPQNGFNKNYQNANSQPYFTLFRFAYGYVDNASNNDEDAAIDIDWAVDKNGKKANLSGIDFVKVYTGINQENGWLGEASTEITGAEDLHLLKKLKEKEK